LAQMVLLVPKVQLVLLVHLVVQLVRKVQLV
jgi:hypothetical protein